MMSKLYALAELRWLAKDEGGIQGVVAGHIFLPAVFQSDQSGNWWTLVVVLQSPVSAGETAVVALTPIVEEAAPMLLQTGQEFELKEGPRTIALGRVLTVHALLTLEGEPPVETLRRVAFGSQDGQDTEAIGMP